MINTGANAGSRNFSASDILDEVDRVPGACDHVAEPLKPAWLYGSRADIESAGAAWLSGTFTDAKSSKKFFKRKVRSDSPWLTAGVVSLPSDRLNDWPKFKAETLKHLKKKYGVRLVGVVEHLDEPHPHLHYYAVPLPGESFGVVHEGYKEKNDARQAGIVITDTFFKEAMRKFQDEFFDAVGRPFGLTRLGPKRTRKTREEWLLEQLQAKLLAVKENFVDVEAHQRTLIDKAQIQYDSLLSKASRLKVMIDSESEKLISKAAAEAKAKADLIINNAKVEALVLVDVEIKKSKKSAGDYFTKARKTIDDEQRIAKDEILKKQLIADNEIKELKRIAMNEINEDVLLVQQAQKVLSGTTAFREIADMRGRIKNAEVAIRVGQFDEAQKQLTIAKAKDFVPRFRKSKNDFDM
jgi:hypothetical protein